MDLLVQARCCCCDKIFCCPEHRRSHELLAHPKSNKKMLQPPTIRKQADSYALGMRKILYSEQNRSNFHRSRKRKYLTVSNIFHEQEEVEMKINRKILVPYKKKKETLQFNELKMTDITEDHDGNDTNEVDETIISPIEVKKGLDINTIFTTSTPLPKRTLLLSSSSPKSRSNQFSAPLESIIEDIPDVISGTQRNCIQITNSYKKRKVTFSESVESVYDTAREGVSSEVRPGIFAAVANVFQAALQRIPGVREAGVETNTVPSVPGGSKRKRASPEGKFSITARRPLHRSHNLWSPQY